MFRCVWLAWCALCVFLECFLFFKVSYSYKYVLQPVQPVQPATMQPGTGMMCTKLGRRAHDRNFKIFLPLGVYILRSAAPLTTTTNLITTPYLNYAATEYLQFLVTRSFLIVFSRELIAHGHRRWVGRQARMLECSILRIWKK